MVSVAIERPREKYTCSQYVLAIKLLMLTEIKTRSVSDIVIPYVSVLGVYLEIDTFIASFCCVSKGLRKYWSRSRIVNGV